MLDLPQRCRAHLAVQAAHWPVRLGVFHPGVVSHGQRVHIPRRRRAQREAEPITASDPFGDHLRRIALQNPQVLLQHLTQRPVRYAVTIRQAPAAAQQRLSRLPAQPQLERAARGRHRPLADQDLPRRGRLLQPCADVDRVPGDERAALAGPPHDDLACIHTDAKREPSVRPGGPGPSHFGAPCATVIGREAELLAGRGTVWHGSLSGGCPSRLVRSAGLGQARAPRRRRARGRSTGG